MKNKIYLLLFIIILVQFYVLLCGCAKKSYVDYKNEEGYAEYISYANKGCKYASYYNIPESIVNNEKALKYYKSNIRECSDFKITDFLDGICINDYVGEIKNNEIIIPEAIEGKPVIAIGTYFHNKYRNSQEVYDRYRGVFDSEDSPIEPLSIHLPSGLKYISEFNVDNQLCTNYIIGSGSVNFFVNEENPYYASENGNLYTKDMKTLLYLSDSTRPNITISKETEIFTPSNNLIGNWGESIKFDKNIRIIDTDFYCEETDEYLSCPFSIKGYADTAAEQWAKENNLNFMVIRE